MYSVVWGFIVVFFQRPDVCDIVGTLLANFAAFPWLHLCDTCGSAMFASFRAVVVLLPRWLRLLGPFMGAAGEDWPVHPSHTPAEASELGWILF